MKLMYLAIAVPILFGGCSNLEQPNANLSKRALPIAATVKNSQFQAHSGNFYRGDGTGYNVNLNLKPDGTYTGQWRGCLGVYGTAFGKWSIKGQQIVLKPAKETDMMKGHLRSLDIIREQKKIFLLPTADRSLARKLSKWGKLPSLFFTKT